MAKTVTHSFMQLFQGLGFGAGWDACDFYVGLCIDGAPAVDPALIWDDVDDFIATYKGFEEQLVTCITSYNSGTMIISNVYDTASMPYDSGEAGDSSNNLTHYYLRAVNGVTDYLLAYGDLPATWVIDSDGQVPTVPVEIQVSIKVPCP